MPKDLKHIQFWRRGREFLEVEYPIIAGAMTWISNSNLIKVVSEAGAFGALAAGNMPPELFEKEVQALLDTNVKFAANLITIAPNYKAHLEIACNLGAPFIVFAGSFPRSKEIRRAKESGAKVMCFASTQSIATRMIEFGADALILEGSEAGGHIGHVSTIVLLQQVLFNFPDIPIFVGGGIATGKMIAHLLLMGAAGAQMGTIFAMSEESPAHPQFKERFRKARAREAMSTPQYDSALPIISVRAIVNKSTGDFGKLQLELLKKLEDEKISRIEAQYQVEHFWVGALRKAVEDGDVESGSLMAGQSVGLVSEVKPIKQIVEELVTDAESEFDKVFQNFGFSPKP